jgi:hypothetical protein
MRRAGSRRASIARFATYTAEASAARDGAAVDD